MRIEYDPEKRSITLKERGLDFARATKVFQGVHFTAQDVRFQYQEDRFITAGWLDARLVVLAWTPRGEARRIISMRKGNDREKALYARHLERP
jgi:uncharacterized DUF497 family protein